MSNASKELLSIYNSLRLILKDSGKLLPMKSWCDNKAAIASAETNGGEKIRHMIEVKEHFAKECVKRNLIQLSWVPSKDQLADLFTKPLAHDLHRKLIRKILNNDY